MRRADVFSQGVAALAIVYVLLYNVHGVTDAFSLPEALAQTGHALGLNQRWDMFAPSPSKWDGWFRIQGQLENGDVVDLLYNRRQPAGERPDPVYPFRYAVYLRFLSHRPDPRPAFAIWLCRDWNVFQKKRPALQHVQMDFYLEETPPPGTLVSVTRAPLFSVACDVATSLP